MLTAPLRRRKHSRLCEVWPPGPLLLSEATLAQGDPIAAQGCSVAGHPASTSWSPAHPAGRQEQRSPGCGPWGGRAASGRQSRRSAEPLLTSLIHRQGGSAAGLAGPARGGPAAWWSSHPSPAFCGALTTEPLPHFTEDGARWAVVPGLLLYCPAALAKQTSEHPMRVGPPSLWWQH